MHSISILDHDETIVPLCFCYKKIFMCSIYPPFLLVDVATTNLFKCDQTKCFYVTLLLLWPSG
jgi:hypothetical protein